MNVTEAVASRRSVRQFQDKPVDQAILERVLAKAQRSPSGGNTQPWNAVILTGAPLADLTAKIKAKAATAPLGDGHEYDIYPKGLEGRYEDQRRGVGQAMFDALGLPAAMVGHGHVAANGHAAAARRRPRQLRAGNMGDVRHDNARITEH
jgi:nitroreductase